MVAETKDVVKVCLGDGGNNARQLHEINSDLTRDSWPRYSAVGKGQCAECGFMCVSTPVPKV